MSPSLLCLSFYMLSLSFTSETLMLFCWKKGVHVIIAVVSVNIRLQQLFHPACIVYTSIPKSPRSTKSPRKRKEAGVSRGPIRHRAFSKHTRSRQFPWMSPGTKEEHHGVRNIPSKINIAILMYKFLRKIQNKDQYKEYIIIKLLMKFFVNDYKSTHTKKDI